jgi:hypothetical protein
LPAFLHFHKGLPYWWSLQKKTTPNSARAQTKQVAFYFQDETQQVTLRILDAYLTSLLASDRKIFLD